MPWPGDGTLIATCGGGAEEAIEKELRDLGLQIGSRANGMVRFVGAQSEMVRANLELRSASRVLAPVVEGRVSNYDGLYRLARKVSWDRIIPSNLTIAVSAVSRERLLSDGRLTALKVKDAIVDSQRRSGKRSSVDRRNPDVPISVFVSDGRATISLDTSGAPLHERGYRTEAGEAPLRETVAAAILLYAGWDGTIPLLDPLCGAGTIVIEAALLATGTPPGALRPRFAFSRWPWITAKVPRARPPAEEADGSALERRPLIVARDHDHDLVEIARRNAHRAGVEHLISFEEADIFEADPPSNTGVIVTNPPYGERMELSESKDFYADLGDRLKRAYGGWNAWILSANRDAMKAFGLRASSRRQLWNGGLDARLYSFEIYPPGEGSS